MFSEFHASGLNQEAKVEMKNKNCKGKIIKAGIILFSLFLASLLLMFFYFRYWDDVHAIFSTHISKVERVQDYGPAEGHIYAHPENTFLMIKLASPDEYISNCILSSIELIDKTGNHYPTGGFCGRCVFEVPISAQGFTLVVNKWIKLPVP